MEMKGDNTEIGKAIDYMSSQLVDVEVIRDAI